MEMQREFRSALTADELLARLRAKTRPWSRTDMWTARNIYFRRELSGGRIRLVKTAAMRGYVYADIQLEALDGGSTRLFAAMGIPKTLYVADIGVCMFFALYLALGLWLGSGVLRGLLYLWVPGLFLWMTRRVRRHLPELAAFIEENLLD